MTSNHDDRTGDTLLAAALLLLSFQALGQLFDVLARGRLLSYGTSLAAFTLLLSTGLIGRRRPRPHTRIALLLAIVGFLALMVAWHLAPGTPRTAPSGRDIARLVMTRYLLLFEWSALVLAIAWQCRPPAPGVLINAPDSFIPSFRIRPTTTVVLSAMLVAGVALVMAGERAGLGPVGPAAALMLFGFGLAMAAVCQSLESLPDA